VVSHHLETKQRWFVTWAVSNSEIAGSSTWWIMLAEAEKGERVALDENHPVTEHFQAGAEPRTDCADHQLPGERHPGHSSGEYPQFRPDHSKAPGRPGDRVPGRGQWGRHPGDFSAGVFQKTVCPRR